MSKRYPYTWEEAVELLRRNPQHQKLIHTSYLSADLVENCHRFRESEEFAEVLGLIRKHDPGAHSVLDIPAGNGIASYAFAVSGYEVIAVEPDFSATVGLKAIEFVKNQENLSNVQLTAAFAESLPFRPASFDVAYIRQGLHHAHDLNRMVTEVVRVLKPGGLIIASREPVVDDYHAGLQSFLEAQPDHQLYGGENAFRHDDYIKALRQPHLTILCDMGQYDSIINLYPRSFAELEHELVNSRSGRILNTFLPRVFLYRLGLFVVKRMKGEQGRLHTFVARKRKG